MKKRKYEYTKSQERDILDAANMVTTILFLLAGAVGAGLFLYMFANHLNETIIVLMIVGITTAIFIYWRALIVINHHKKASSQDDNIESEEDTTS